MPRSSADVTQQIRSPQKACPLTAVQCLSPTGAIMSSDVLWAIFISMGVLVASLRFGLFRQSKLSPITYDAESFFAVQRLFFAAGVLPVLAFMLMLSFAVYFRIGQEGNPINAGQEVFDSMVKVIPPIITLVLGYYFCRQIVSTRAMAKKAPSGAAQTSKEIKNKEVNPGGEPESAPLLRNLLCPRRSHHQVHRLNLLHQVPRPVRRPQVDRP